MFVKRAFRKGKIRNLVFKLFNAIENNGNPNFKSNGEECFINNLCVAFSENIKERVVFDIGANIGDYSKIMEEKGLEYGLSFDLHLFEPTKSCFAVLNGSFDPDNVTLNNFGASDKSETATIFLDKEGSALASLYPRNLDSYGLKLDRREKIKLRRLDRYIEEKEIRHIDFVKIDIEGHELRAFEGFGDYLNGGFIDYIQFEYGGANLDSHSSLMDIYQFLSGRGFVVAKVMPKGLDIREYAPYMDNFQYSNYMAISKKVLE